MLIDTRRGIVAWIVAVAWAVGTTVLLSLAAPAQLTSPVACPGLYDFAIVFAARTFADSTLASILIPANTAVLFVSLTIVFRLVHSTTASVPIAIATVLVASPAPSFHPTLAPMAAAAALAAWAAALLHGSQAAGAVARPRAAAASFALAAGIVPAFTVPAALVVGWRAWVGAAARKPAARIARAAGAVSAVVVPPLVVLAALPPISALTRAGSSCLLPSNATAQAFVGAGATFGASPVVVGLALVGLIGAGAAARSARAGAIIPFAAALWAAGTGTEPARALAPAALALWLLTAAGVAEIWAALSMTARRRAGAVTLIIAVVVLQLLRLPTGLSAGASLGHERLSSSLFAGLAQLIPEGAALTIEDALTDLAIRTLPARVRDRRLLGTIAPDPGAIGGLPSGTRLFALPLAQLRLQHLGFRLDDVGGSRVRGLARATPAGACAAPLTTTWQPLPELRSAQQLAVVAVDRRSHGPVHLLFAGDTPLHPRALDWPEHAVRGFTYRSFALSAAGDADRLTAELESYGASAHRAALTGAHVARVEMWRTPGAPLILPIGVGGSPGVVLGRLGQDDRQGIVLCPSFPHEVGGIGG